MSLISPLGLSLHKLEENNRFIDLNGVRADVQPLFRFRAQRQAFVNGLEASGVICGNCRINGACKAAGTTQPTAPALGAGGSQRLRDGAVAYLLGDAVAWDSMASDATMKDALFQDLIHLAREKAERVQVPVEWEATYHPPTLRRSSSYSTQGKVRATEEALHVVDVTESIGVSYTSEQEEYISVPQYMNRQGQWGPINPPYRSQPETVKTGWFSKEQVFRASWSDKPPQPGLDDILKRAAELLAPAA